MAGATLPERVAQIYYTYGLFCSSYPATVIAVALSVILLCCYPLLNVPLPGNIPTVVTLPMKLDVPEAKVKCNGHKCSEVYSQLELLHNETQRLPYVWAKDRPLLYVQQIIMKIGVSPWNSNLKMWDAFRAPLQEVFRLLESIRNHEDPETKTSLVQHCYQIGGIKRRDSAASVERVLPEYSCLVLSPASLWQQSLQTFSLDANIVNTVYRYQKAHEAKASIAEMAFGMQLRDTGIKRYPLRARPRLLQYAVTLFYHHPDDRFIRSLTEQLKEKYPLYRDEPHSRAEEATLVYYPGQFNYRELVPLTITFFGLFLYVYFSVRKIEVIKSKLGLAACAVLTIASSLSVSMGICFYFGFSLSLQGREIFPYLVVIVGLENVLVLTESVTSTDARLDVKIRLAQGLAREGWSITKNLLVEITILTVSFFTFVPFIQEFSIFMIVSLISDFFIQMAFFATVLGVEVRRIEFFRDQNRLHLKEYFDRNASSRRFDGGFEELSPQRMRKSKSHPRLNGAAPSPTDVVAKMSSSPAHREGRVPKRIRLVNMWARTRFFQRAFMVWMLVWVSMIAYHSGVVEYFVGGSERGEGRAEERRGEDSARADTSSYGSGERSALVFPPLPDARAETGVDTNQTITLKHSPLSRPWARLPAAHWAGVLSQYNESSMGRHVAVLPPVLLSHRVPPELAAAVRHPDERDPPPLRWPALAAALDPLDAAPEFETDKGQSHPWGKGSELPIYPTTPMEILLLAILCTISVAVIAYMMVVLYRCVCSRHYAEWRASWNDDGQHKKIIAAQPAVQLVMEAVPLVVAGHAQEVECVAADGDKVVSCCLQGELKVWDAHSGDLLTNIDRNNFFKLQKKLFEKVNAKKNPTVSLEAPRIEEIAPRKGERAGGRLRRALGEHLRGLRFRAPCGESAPHLSVAETTKYHFAKNYRDLYCSERSENASSHVTNEYADVGDRSPNEAKRSPNRELLNNRDSISNGDSGDGDGDGDGSGRARGAASGSVPCEVDGDERTFSNLEWRESALEESPVWCMDLYDDFIVAGCADGRVELWEAASGKLLCVWRSTEARLRAARGECGAGVTHARALCGGRRLCVASLAGHVTLLRVDAYNHASGHHVDWTFSTAHRRSHKRTGSAGSLRSSEAGARSRGFHYESSELSDGDEVVCARVAQCRPHQQPITELQCEGGRILTGSQDHVLKVLCSGSLRALFTLHGHCGPVSSSFIDHATPTIAGSGSQDGMLAVWDLHTGACVYSMQAHDGAVTSLAYTASYVVSAGADERLCIWDRFQGHMLNSLHIGVDYMSRMLPLTHTLLVMGGRSGLTAYDLSSGDVIRRVLLGESAGVWVRQILPLKDAIVCDYANQLRIVRFPLVSKMSDVKNE